MTRLSTPQTSPQREQANPTPFSLADAPECFERDVDLVHEESEQKHGPPLTAAQCALLDDPSRYVEAIGMLDDMEARLVYDVSNARVALRARDTIVKAGGRKS
jgi:hypothetical protein